MEDIAPMVVAIVFITTVAHYLRQRSTYKHKERMGKIEGAAPPADVTRRLKDLEERVRVLESIVTDRNYELNREFEELRRP